MASKKGLGIGLTDKAAPKRSVEDPSEKIDHSSVRPDDGGKDLNKIHGPGKGAHTEESEVRPHRMPGAEKPRRA